jgi:hypothetical protein
MYASYSFSFLFFPNWTILIFNFVKVNFQHGVVMHIFFNLINFHKYKSSGWKSFKVYHIGQKRPSPYNSHFLPYILIPIKNNESNVVKNVKRTIF